MKTIAVLIDGGHVRVLARRAGHQFKANFLEKVGASCAATDEDIQRILFYDCRPVHRIQSASRVRTDAPVSGY